MTTTYTSFLTNKFQHDNCKNTQTCWGIDARRRKFAMLADTDFLTLIKAGSHRDKECFFERLEFQLWDAYPNPSHFPYWREGYDSHERTAFQTAELQGKLPKRLPTIDGSHEITSIPNTFGRVGGRGKATWGSSCHN